MKKLSSSLPAFTLIELLLAVVVFVSVASFATLTLATTVRLQASQNQAKLVATQVEQAMGEIDSDIHSATTFQDTDGVALSWPYNAADTSDAARKAAASIQLANLSTNQSSLCSDGPACYPSDSVLVLTVPALDANGLATGSFQKRVYCAEPQYSPGGDLIGKRLIRLTGKTTSAAAFARFTHSNTHRCTVADMNNEFDPVQDFSRSELTDLTTQVISLRFWPVWSTAKLPAVPADYVFDAPAIRVELTARYNASNTIQARERRAGDQSTFGSPIVFRNLINRNSAYSTGQHP